MASFIWINWLYRMNFFCCFRLQHCFSYILFCFSTARRSSPVSETLRENPVEVTQNSGRNCCTFRVNLTTLVTCLVTFPVTTAIPNLRTPPIQRLPVVAARSRLRTWPLAGALKPRRRFPLSSCCSPTLAQTHSSPEQVMLLS